MTVILILVALIATANVAYASTGTPVTRSAIALAGFVCGVSWSAVAVRGLL